MRVLNNLTSIKRQLFYDPKVENVECINMKYGILWCAMVAFSVPVCRLKHTQEGKHTLETGNVISHWVSSLA